MGFEMFGCNEWIVSVIKAMYDFSPIEGKWERKQGLQCQSGTASGLSPHPLLFIIVLEALSFHPRITHGVAVRRDLDLVANTEELLMEKLRTIEEGYGFEGSVNIGKTKVMSSQV